MNEIVRQTAAIRAMTPELLGDIRKFRVQHKKRPQLKLLTQHVIHGGMYLRTVKLDAGVAISGVLIKIPTVLIVNGRMQTMTNEGVVEYSGHCVIPGSAGRMQVIIALEDTYLTMAFPTKARTVEDAEKEFTDEYEHLMSHECDNEVVITGE